MTNEADNRAKLVENRKEIADEAKKLADASDRKFLIDAGFIGGLGTALTTIFTQYEDSAKAIIALGGSSAALIATSHITGSFDKALYTGMSKAAEKDAFDFKHGRSIEDEESMFFDDYKRKFEIDYKHSFTTLRSIRSTAIACSIGIMAAFMVAQDVDSKARKEEDLEETISQESYPALVNQQ